MRKVGASALALFATSACSAAPSPAARPLTPIASAPTLPAWQRDWLPAARAQGTASVRLIDDPVGAVCQSHAGCEGAGRRLPACTAPGVLPNGFQHLRGRLEPSASAQATGLQDVLLCVGRDHGQMQLVTAEKRYDLGLGCTGDRTGWCCPYPAGTSVQLIAKVASTPNETPSLSEYWLCAEPGAAPPPPSVVASAPPALVDLGEAPGAVVWTTQRGLALWRLSEPAPVVLPQPSATPFACVSVAPNWHAAFTIDGAGEAALWSLPQARKLTTVPGFAPPRHAERIEPDTSCSYLLSRKLEWSPNAERLLTVQVGSVVRLWDSVLGTQQKLDPLHAEFSTHANYFSPDGAQLLVPTAAGQLELRRATDGSLLAQTKGSAGRFAPDQQQVLVDDSHGAGSELRAWQPKSGAVRMLLANACGAQLSQDGRVLAAASPCNSDHTTVVELATGRHLLEHDNRFRPLFSSSHYRAARFRDDLAFLIEKAEAPSRPRDFSAAPAKPELLALPRPDGVEVWSQGRTLAKLAVTVRQWTLGLDRDARLAFSPDGKTLASSEWLWSSSLGKRAVALDAAVPSSQLLFSPDSRFLATWAWSLASGASPGAMTMALRVFEVGSGKLVQRFDLTGVAAPRQAQLGLSSPAWLPHSSVLLLPVLGDAAALELLNVTDGSRVRVALAADGVNTPTDLGRLRDFLNNVKH